jgi:hypothetical protein
VGTFGDRVGNLKSMEEQGADSHGGTCVIVHHCEFGVIPKPATGEVNGLKIGPKNPLGGVGSVWILYDYGRRSTNSPDTT